MALVLRFRESTPWFFVPRRNNSASFLSSGFPHFFTLPSASSLSDFFFAMVTVTVTVNGRN
jgi:hypothetical protein